MAFAAGILIGERCWRPASWWLAAFVVCMLAALQFWKERAGEARSWRIWLAWWLTLAGVMSLGAWCIQTAETAPHPPDLSRFASGQTVTVTGHVVRDGVLSGHPPWQRVLVEVETEEIVDAQGGKTGIVSGMRLSLYPHGVPNPRGASIVPETCHAGVAPVSRPAVGADSSPHPASACAGVDAHATADLEVGATDLRKASAEDSAQAGETGSHCPHPCLLRSGQRVRFPIKLRPPRDFGNPGAADVRGYLWRQGISATGSVREDRVELLSGEHWPSRQERWVSSVRRGIVVHIDRLWSPDQAALFSAILLGERALLDRETREAWQSTGLYHLLVIDGLKVAILAGAAFWLSTRFRTNEFVASALTLAAAGAYACLAEMTTPTARAVLMLGVYLLTRLLYRGRAPLNALGAAALFLLTLDPRALFDASFQLSFFALAAILGLAVPIMQRTSAPWRRALRYPASPDYDLLVPPRMAQFRIDLRRLAQSLAAWLPVRAPASSPIVLELLCRSGRGALYVYDIAVLSVLLQGAMTLPMITFFHRGTVLGIPANLIAVPLTGILVPLATVALMLSYIWLPLARLPAGAAGWVLGGIVRSARGFAGMRLGDLRLPDPDPLPIIAFLLALLVAMLLVRRRGPLAAAAVMALLLAAVWLTVAPAHPHITPGVLEITGIDVGQAESTLVVTPEGKTVLIDAGGPLGPFHSDFDFGEAIIAPYLWSRGISHLDAVAVTHGHSDHIGGMPGVVAIFHPHELWLGVNPETPALQRLRQQLQQSGAPVISRGADGRFTFGGAEFRVLSPPRDWQAAAQPRNNDSLVLSVSFGHTSALLTGDAEKMAEREMVAELPRADLLKVAHNGSNTSTTQEFLDAVHPGYAMIYVGADNTFGHPRPEVLERLARAHVTTYRTDTAGTITFFLNGNRVWMQRHGNAGADQASGLWTVPSSASSAAASPSAR